MEFIVIHDNIAYIKVGRLLLHSNRDYQVYVYIPVICTLAAERVMSTVTVTRINKHILNK